MTLNQLLNSYNSSYSIVTWWLVPSLLPQLKIMYTYFFYFSSLFQVPNEQFYEKKSSVGDVHSRALNYSAIWQRSGTEEHCRSRVIQIKSIIDTRFDLFRFVSKTATMYHLFAHITSLRTHNIIFFRSGHRRSKIALSYSIRSIHSFLNFNNIHDGSNR
jgi:hypothetical protein